MDRFDAGWQAAMDAMRSLLSSEGMLAAVALLDQAEAHLAEYRARQTGPVLPLK